MDTQEPEVLRPVPMRRTYCVWMHPDGERCWGLARKGSRHCYWHDPDTRRERETGGPPQSPLILTTEPGADSSNPATPSEAQSLLRQIARYLATTPNPDVGRAHALSTVALHLLKSETRRVERELATVRGEINRLQAA